MTYTLEQTTRFIDQTIERYDRSIEWANSHFKNDGWTFEKAYDYARGCIENDYEQGFGALLFVNIYLKEITDSQYKKLADRLSDEKFDRIGKLAELIG